MRKDQKHFGIDESSWFHQAQEGSLRRGLPHTLKRNRAREETKVAFLLLQLMPQVPPYPCWCTPPVLGYSEGDRTSPGTGARQPARGSCTNPATATELSQPLVAETHHL